MRVLHLTTEFPPVIYGGLGTALGGLAFASVRAGITVGVLLAGEMGLSGYAGSDSDLAEQSGDGDDRVQAVTRQGGVTIFHVPSYLPVEAAVRLVRAWKPDVVHLHVYWLWPVARAIQERTGVPLVYHVHSLDRAEYEIGHGPSECITQWGVQEEVIASADRVVALTRSESELLSEYCPAVQGRVRIVGNGIEDSPAASAAVDKCRDTDSPLVLYTGRFVERKGVRELISAVPRVLERAPATRFVLAGGHRNCSGADMEYWWLPPELKGYRDRIHFTGWLTPAQLVNWYLAADVLAVPSWYEPFGMVILEGMLYGLPIVAAEVGGPAEILEHGRTGLLCPPKDAGALGDSILALVTDAGLRRRLGVAAAAEVRNVWLWTHVVKKMRAVYREAAAGPPGSPFLQQGSPFSGPRLSPQG
jgi:glycosyltransferase involved in cell wall biosynthesis